MGATPTVSARRHASSLLAHSAAHGLAACVGTPEATVARNPVVSATGTAPPPPRSGTATPGTLRVVGTAVHHATAQYRVPSVQRLPAAVPIPDGPSRAAARSPQPPAHLGAVDAPLDGAVRPGASPTPLAHPCEPSAAPPASRAPSSPSQASHVRYTPSRCCPQPPQLGGHPSGQPSSAPQAACESQDRPSNQIQSNQSTDPYAQNGGLSYRGGGGALDASSLPTLEWGGGADHQ